MHGFLVNGFANANVSVWLKPPGLRIENDAAPVPLLQYSCAIGAISPLAGPVRLRRLTSMLVACAKGVVNR